MESTNGTLASVDGLRGVAAFFVVIHHSSLLWFDWDLHSGWNGTIAGNNKWFFQLPIIRLPLSGPPQVAIFFAVSGYALSYKPLKLARQRRYAEAGTALSSSIFRRHSRLYMPAVAVSFVTAIASFLGCFTTWEAVPVAQSYRNPPKLDTLWDQLFDYARIMVAWANPIKDPLPNWYDDNTWTLSVEFRCSMVLFTWLVASTRLSSKVRILFTLVLAWYVEWILVNWALFLFLGGMVICDVHFEIEGLSPPREDDLPYSFVENASFDTSTWTGALAGMMARVAKKIWCKEGYLRKIIGLASFIFALYIISTPEIVQGRSDSVGYRVLAKIMPDRAPGMDGDDELLIPVAALWLLCTVDGVNFLQVLFTNRFSQYLGRISYSLYLVHGPLLWSLGAFLGNMIVPLVGKNTPGLYVLGVALTAAVWWPIAICIADLINRLVDTKSVALGRWVYNKLEQS